MPARKTPPEAWVDAAFAALAEGGPDAIRIEALAASLGVTKGGFYGEFADRDALIERVLDSWERAFVDDVIARIVAQPQAARFITAKLWNYFTGQYPSDELNTALAAVFRANGNNFKPFLRVMFRSEEFYGEDIVRNQVKSPVQWLVGSVRLLECDLPPTLVSWGMLRQLGQDLFAPPNVKGWDGGVTWITTNTLLTRYNDAQSLVEGTLPPLNASDFAKKPGGGGGEKYEKAMQRVRMGGVNVEKILDPDERANNEAIIASLQHRLFQTALRKDQQEALQEFLDSKTKMSDGDIVTAIRLMMSTPDYQVT